MFERRIIKFTPNFDWLEAKRPLSGAASAQAADAQANPEVSAEAVTKKPDYGFLVYRITNPDKYNNSLTPPFTQVMVQTKQPVPGQVYNVLYVAVRNGTAQTFNASSNFSVRFPGDPTTFPILTGTQEWKPGQEFVFYVLSKDYYPLPSEVHSGFEFSLDGARSVGIPGPSGIYLGVKYNPARFDKTLNWIVAFGPGAQGGTGIKYGLPDTAIYEFLSSKTNRNDFSGYF
jgi:hypothetical protein